MKCPFCGTEVSEQDQVCGYCNTPLHEDGGAGDPAGALGGNAAAGEGGAPEGSFTAGGDDMPGGSFTAGGDAAPEGSFTAGGDAAPEGGFTAGGGGAPEGGFTAGGDDMPGGSFTAGGSGAPAGSYASGGDLVPPKASKKGGKIAALVAAAVAVVGIGAFGMSKLAEKDPKEAVIDAFKSVNAKGQAYPAEEIFGLSQFGENAKGSVEAGLSVLLDSCSVEDTDMLAGSGLRMDEKVDRENKKELATLAAVYNNMDLLSFNVYYGDEVLMASVPELLDKVFVADLSDGLEERLEASPTIGPMLPVLKDQGVDIVGAVSYMKELIDKSQEEEVPATYPYDLEGLFNRYKEGCKAQEDFKAAMTVEKTDKGKFMMDGKEVTCKGYQVHVSKDSMIEFLRTSSDFFLQDEELKAAYLENLEMGIKFMEFFGAPYMVTAIDGNSLSAEEMQEKTYEEVSEQVQYVITELDKALQDVDMTVYVDPKGRLAAVNGSTAIVAKDADPVPVAFDVTLNGGSYLVQNAQINVTAGEGDKQASLGWARSGSYDGKQLTGSHRFTMEGGDSSLVVDLDGQYTVEGGAYRLDADVLVDEVTKGKFVMSGVVDELEKGTSIHCTMDEIRLELIPEDPDKFELVLDGEYYFRPLSSEVAELEGDRLDVFAADEGDWQGVMLQAYFGAMGLMSQLDIDL